jgi:hypothetical protein
MDPDELATAGYATLSPATRSKLASLPKGELMLRHPHFAQPVFVRFPRPAVLSGREGVTRFPPAPDLPFEDAVVHQLKQLDRTIAGDAVRELIHGRGEDDVRRALGAVRRSRPDDILAFFRAALGRMVTTELPVERRRAIPSVPLRDDPYR